MIASGFSGVDSRFDDVDKRFGDMGGEIQGLRTEVGEVKSDVKSLTIKVERALYTEYVHLEGRVSRLEKKVGVA